MDRAEREPIANLATINFLSICGVIAVLPAGVPNILRGVIERFSDNDVVAPGTCFFSRPRSPVDVLVCKISTLAIRLGAAGRFGVRPAVNCAEFLMADLNKDRDWLTAEALAVLPVGVWNCSGVVKSIKCTEMFLRLFVVGVDGGLTAPYDADDLSIESFCSNVLKATLLGVE